MNTSFRPRKVLGQVIRIMTAKQIHDFLMSFTPTELAQAREMWRQYASRKDMSQFLGSKYTLSNMQYYQWVESATRHLRRIPYTSIKADVLRFSRGVRAQLRTLTQDLIAGKLSGQDWYDQTNGIMKIADRAAFMIEEGGYELFQSIDREDRWLSAIVPTYLAIANKADELSRDKVELNGRLLTSTNSYADSVNTHFENWRFNFAMDEGYTEARRVLTGGEHCEGTSDRPGCIELAAKGWQPMWHVNMIGTAACYHKCHCYLEYR